MFNSYKIVSHGWAKKATPPIKIKEEAGKEQLNDSPLPPDGFRTSKKRRVDGGGCQIEDGTVLVELAWAARDVTASDCPRSRKQLWRRLQSDRQQKSNECIAKKLDIEGIGEMGLSDESPGMILTTSSDENSEEDEKIEETTAEEMLSASDGPDNVQETHHNGFDSGRRNAKKGEIEKILNAKRADLNTPVPRRLPSTALTRSPYGLAHGLLLHLVLSCLARHDFRDALQLMSLFLIEAYRPLPHDVPVELLRLFNQFNRVIPELRFSDIHVELVRKCYGTPSILVSHFHEVNSFSAIAHESP